MKVFYLRFPSEAAMGDALADAGMWGEDFVPINLGDALDVIGTIVKPTGNTIEIDGEQVEETAPVEGWHANLLLTGAADISELAPYVIEPDHPVRVFAGWSHEEIAEAKWP